jgi:RNA polymerase sigma factor (sigma-70 family)
MLKSSSGVQTCGQCGGAFPVVASRARRTRYCSKVCMSLAKQDRVTFRCAYPPCDNSFTCKKSGSTYRKYCSLDCFYDDRTIPIKPLGFTELERSQAEALVIRYESLVKGIARRLFDRFVTRTMDLDDFVQEGMIGLFRAYQLDDDPTRPFNSYAIPFIRFAMIEAWRKSDPFIRLPESMFRKDANVTPDELEQAKAMSTGQISLEALTSRPQRTHSLESPVEQKMLAQEKQDALYAALLKLPEQQRTLIAEHYGLQGDALAMRQLSYRYGLSTSGTFRLVHGGLAILWQSLH